MSTAEMSVNVEFSGASPEAIQYHYDVGTEFYRLWLDGGLIYSAARWHDSSRKLHEVSLEKAQERKLDFHLASVGTRPGFKLLDVGCGWGGLLSRAVTHYGIEKGVGLTLSEAQHSHIAALHESRIQAILSSYASHPRDEKYDGIISIGAFEHFVRPNMPSDEKIDVYRGFFERCSGWLSPGGRLSLQSITWGNIPPEFRIQILPQDVFPESDLPTVEEIFAASAGVLQVVRLENNPLDYAVTLEEWLRRLRARRQEILRMDGGGPLFEAYEDYLRKCIVGFRRNRINLVRIVFERPRG